MTVTRTSSAHAQVADSRAVTRLLDERPEAKEIRAQLRKPRFARRWQQSMQRSFRTISDGQTAMCLTLAGLDVDEMVAVWVAFDAYRLLPGFSLSATTLGGIIQAEPGVVVEFEN